MSTQQQHTPTVPTSAEVYSALENIIRAEGLTPLFTYAEAIKLPHVASAHIEDDRVYVSSRQIAPNTYGHPLMEAQARLTDKGWWVQVVGAGRKYAPLAIAKEA